VEHEHLLVGGWPVQFLPAADALEEEAIQRGVETEVDGVPTWVMPAEHLIAIALRTGRPKDHARILQFLEQHAYDSDKLTTLLDRHSLTKRWRAFESKYGSGE
jgi:hypothetical protein